MIEISPSVLGADLLHLCEAIELVERLGINWLHVDNMDGHFVPNISFGPSFVAAIRRKTRLFLDVHLMLSDPRRYIAEYAEAGADLITVHAEIEDDVEEVLRSIAALGAKTGLSIKPGTSPETIRRLLPLCDLVLVMTVEPGFGGQSLREDCLAKLPVLHRMIEECGRDVYLEVDGGIKMDNARRVVEAGADVLVTGTGLFRAKDPAAFVAALRGLEACKPCAR